MANNTADLLNQYTAEADAGVSFSGLFSALTIFFAGLLITNYDSYPSFVRIPLLFLIISTFGFVYATLIYANSTGKLHPTSLKECRAAINTADILSEFMGVYALLIAIPLVIPVVTQDLFLITAVYITDMIGLLVYHFSGFSIILKYFPHSHLLISILIIILSLLCLLMLNSLYQPLLLFYVFTTLALLVFISYKAIKIPHR